MKKSIIILLFFIILSNFNNAFVSSNSNFPPYIFSCGTREKSLSLAVKVDILGYCDCLFQYPELAENFRQQAENNIINNINDNDFRKEMTRTFNEMRKEFRDTNYVFKPGNNESDNRETRISYAIYKFENLLNSDK